MGVAGQFSLCSCSRLDLCLGSPAWLDDLGTWGSFQGLSSWWVLCLGATSCCGLQEPRGRDIQNGLRTLVHKECQMGKKAGEGVGDPPGVANGYCTAGVAAKQLQ